MYSQQFRKYVFLKCRDLCYASNLIDNTSKNILNQSKDMQKKGSFHYLSDRQDGICLEQNKQKPSFLEEKRKNSFKKIDR